MTRPTPLKLSLLDQLKMVDSRAEKNTRYKMQSKPNNENDKVTRPRSKNIKLHRSRNNKTVEGIGSNLIITEVGLNRNRGRIN